MVIIVCLDKPAIPSGRRCSVRKRSRDASWRWENFHCVLLDNTDFSIRSPNIPDVRVVCINAFSNIKNYIPNLKLKNNYENQDLVKISIPQKTQPNWTSPAFHFSQICNRIVEGQGLYCNSMCFIAIFY